METEKNNSKGQEPASRALKQPISAWFLLAALLLIYNSNMRSVKIDDSLPASLLPFSIISNHTFNLDRWSSRVQFKSAGHNSYFIRKVHGHLYSAYPIILPVTITPLYILPDWILSSQHSRPMIEGLLTPLLVDTMEKLCASLIAALSVVVLYLALRKKTSPNASLFIALIYGLASNTFCTSSQALWRQGFTELCFAFLIWSLWRESSDESRAFWAGVALGAAAANNLAEMAFVVPFLFYFARRSRKQLGLCLLPMTVLGALVIAYNLHYFGRFLGGYPNLFYMRHTSSAAVMSPFYAGLAGLLVSPSRGLLIYAPWTLFALWGAARSWRENSWGWEKHVMIGLVIYYAAHAKMGQWWGGWCFGPRYLTDLLPFFAIFLLPVWERIRAARFLQVALALAVGFSLWVQIVGTYYYPNGSWDSKPTFVEFAPQRLWNWSDTQLSRTWRAGPAPAELPYEWIDFFKAVHAADRSQNKARPQPSAFIIMKMRR